jgi:hypothetical protein
MAVYDVPAALYDTFLQRCQWVCTEPLLFEHAVSPVIITSLFRQLWSEIGGVLFLLLVTRPNLKLIVQFHLHPHWRTRLQLKLSLYPHWLVT